MFPALGGWVVQDFEKLYAVYIYKLVFKWVGGQKSLKIPNVICHYLLSPQSRHDLLTYLTFEVSFPSVLHHIPVKSGKIQK